MLNEKKQTDYLLKSGKFVLRQFYLETGEIK